jgi:hypothetical protein
MTHKLETYGNRVGGRRLSGSLAAILLVAGCGARTNNSPGPTPSDSEVPVEPSITLYEDEAFTYPIGKIGSFAIDCADYKDPQKQSLQPSNVNWYKVTEDPPMHTPPLEGYVNPAQRPFVTGTAPQCEE